MTAARDIAAVLALLERGGLDPMLPEVIAAAERCVDQIADLAVSLVARQSTS